MGAREFRVWGKKLVVHELEHVCDPVTGRVLSGSWVWDSALISSQWMTAQSDYNLTGKTVLELGAGATGLPGLTAAMLGATRVVLTDIDLLIPALSKNVEANGLDSVVHVRKLVWGSQESLGEFDVVLMSDVFFDPEEMGALAKTLKGACGDDTMVWAATEIRPLTWDCLNVLAGKDFGIVELPGLDQCSVSFAVFCIVPLRETAQTK